jgi:DNA polymerase (family X)
MGSSVEGNRTIARRLRRAAELLEQQEETPYRAQAYRHAADTIAGLGESVAELLDRGGVTALTELPGVGPSIAGAVREMVRTGRWGRLETLSGSIDPEDTFRTLPGLGPILSRRIHDALGVDTLEALETAVDDGRIHTVPGLGPRRVAALRAELASMLARRPLGPLFRRHAEPEREPPVEVLLDVDREYRSRAEAGTLPVIAPRRWNPDRAAWLPILHTERRPWRLTALYSNTRRAHEIGRTRDWVVIYFHDGDARERQRTVVTETSGDLAGQRVVRGREHEQMAQPRAA